MNKTILIVLNILILTQVSCNNTGKQSKKTNIKDSGINSDGVYIIIQILKLVTLVYSLCMGGTLIKHTGRIKIIISKENIEL